MNTFEKRKTLDLPVEKGARFFISPDKYQNLMEELNTFLQTEDYMNTKDFVTKVMFSYELKANNLVEGYTDDILLIKDITQKYDSIKDAKKRDRIMNLHQAYSYILTHKDINRESLKELYAILSNNLLNEGDIIRMGEYYRTAPVYILKKGRIDCEPYEGVKAENIDSYMQKYFDFLHESIDGDITDIYIKSQILHFYFVYIHPFFDVNGRTSRTIAMWFLNNHEAYPYIIFNRGISFRDCDYMKVIEQVRSTRDLSDFISFMLETVKVELEKEYIIESITQSTPTKMSLLDYQTLLLFLAMNGMKTVSDFATMYNRFNEKKKRKVIFEEMIDPLLTSGVLEVERETKKNMFDDVPNMVLKLNKKRIDNNPHKIKRLII